MLGTRYPLAPAAIPARTSLRRVPGDNRLPVPQCPAARGRIPSPSAAAMVFSPLQLGFSARARPGAHEYLQDRRQPLRVLRPLHQQQAPAGAFPACATDHQEYVARACPVRRHRQPAFSTGAAGRPNGMPAWQAGEACPARTALPVSTGARAAPLVQPPGPGQGQNGLPLPATRGFGKLWGQRNRLHRKDSEE